MLILLQNIPLDSIDLNQLNHDVLLYPVDLNIEEP